MDGCRGGRPTTKWPRQLNAGHEAEAGRPAAERAAEEADRAARAAQEAERTRAKEAERSRQQQWREDNADKHAESQKQAKILQAEILKARGNEQFKEGQYEEASKLYRRALAIHHGPQVWILPARIRRRRMHGWRKIPHGWEVLPRRWRRPDQTWLLAVTCLLYTSDAADE